MSVWFTDERAQQRTLRAPWRLLIFIMVTGAAWTMGTLLGGIVLHDVVGDPASAARMPIMHWTILAATLVAHYVCVRWVDGRSWDFAFMGRAALRPALLWLGLMWGTLAIGLPSALLLATGQLRVDATMPGSWWSAALAAAAWLLPAALIEELVVRGYPFAVLRQAVGWRWALILTSLVFGLLHLMNPGVDAEAVLLVILAGFFLGAILLATRSLYAAWMAHFAWNWTMAALLHAPVSGQTLPAPDYRIVETGPDWLTGGGWGPEGGAAAAAGMFLLVFYLYGRRLRRMELRDG